MTLGITQEQISEIAILTKKLGEISNSYISTEIRLDHFQYHGFGLTISVWLEYAHSLSPNLTANKTINFLKKEIRNWELQITNRR